MCAYAYYYNVVFFTNYGVKFIPATENVLKKLSFSMIWNNLDCMQM